MARFTELYRHYDELDRLLYVGVSSSALVRFLSGHRSNATWADRTVKITIERFPTREEALGAEQVAIKTEGPIHNGISWIYCYWADPGCAIDVPVDECCLFLGLDPNHDSDREIALAYLKEKYGVPSHREEPDA